MKSGSIFKERIEVNKKFIRDRLRGAKQFIKKSNSCYFISFSRFLLRFAAFFGEMMPEMHFLISRLLLVYCLSLCRFVTSRMTRMIGRGVNYKLFSLVFNFVESSGSKNDKAEKKDFSFFCFSRGPFNIFLPLVGSSNLRTSD